MIDEIKKDLRAQIDVIQDSGYPMDRKSWVPQDGVLLSGVGALALLEYIESFAGVSFDEVKLHGIYQMRNGDVITITMYDPHDFHCFGGYVDGEAHFFTKEGRRSSWYETQNDLVAEIKNK